MNKLLYFAKVNPKLWTSQTVYPSFTFGGCKWFTWKVSWPMGRGKVLWLYFHIANMSFNVFRKTIAILADSQHSEEWKQTLREHEEKKDRVIEKYKTKCEQKRVRTLTVIIKNILLNSLSNHQFSLFHRGHRWVSNKRDLKIPRRRRQRELQKSNRFDKQNNNFAHASRFFVHFFASTARLRRETS